MGEPIQKISLQETVGGKTLTLQTGTIAKQAGGSVTAHLGDTVTLTAATAAWTAKDVDFVTLTSEYRERTYAAGRIPGGGTVERALTLNTGRGGLGGATNPASMSPSRRR